MVDHSSRATGAAHVPGTYRQYSSGSTTLLGFTPTRDDSRGSTAVRLLRALP